MSYILIKQGTYRNERSAVTKIENRAFPVVREVRQGRKSLNVVVDASRQIGPRFPRLQVNVESDSFEVCEAHVYEHQIETLPALAEIAPVTNSKTEFTAEDDERRMNEIEERFEILNEMTGSLKSGDIRAMIVSGPPGVGKSYGVTQTLEEQSIFEDIGGKRRKFEVVKGAMTALGLYAKLYEFSDKGSVLVFDDCDSVLMDDLALNILKAALDSGKKRKIFWNADSIKLRNEGIPDSFEFKGSACFITNIKFENIKSKRLQDHLEALQSRCHYLDLTLDTMRDKYLRIRQIARTGKLFQGYEFDADAEKEVLDFMYENRNKLREMSLRMALKIADLKKISEKWRMLAESTCMRRA